MLEAIIQDRRLREAGIEIDKILGLRAPTPDVLIAQPTVFPGENDLKLKRVLLDLSEIQGTFRVVFDLRAVHFVDGDMVGRIRALDKPGLPVALCNATPGVQGKISNRLQNIVSGRFFKSEIEASGLQDPNQTWSDSGLCSRVRCELAQRLLDRQTKDQADQAQRRATNEYAELHPPLSKTEASGPALDVITTPGSPAIAACRYSRLVDGSPCAVNFNQKLAETTDNAIAAGQNLVVDLSDVAVLGSGGLGALTRTYHALKHHSFRLAVVKPAADAARHVLDISQLGLLFTCCESRDEAIRALSPTTEAAP